MAKRMDFAYLPLDDIDVSELNVRRNNPNEGIEELASSIKQIGVQQPVVVFKEGTRYKLIIGQRRYLACKSIGEKEIPALIVEKKNELDSTIISFIENIHRLDLDYKDKMQVAIELLNTLKSIEEVAKKLGVSVQTVNSYIGYKAVPEEIKQMVSDNKLGASTALRIARTIPDKDRAIAIAKLIKETPRNEDRLRLIEIAKENPDKDLAKVAEIANGTKFTKLTLDLTPRLIRAIDNAREVYNGDRRTVAILAIEDWLKGKGYLGDKNG